MIILGLNAYHGDSSACIVVDGQLVAAVEEERFKRTKHWAGFPVASIRYCLETAGVKAGDIDHVAVNRNPASHILKKALFAMRRRPSLDLVRDRVKNAVKVRGLKETFAEAFPDDAPTWKARVHNVEHHLAHLGSSFFVSPHQESALVSVDGFGDFVGAMWGLGRQNKIEARDRIFFPHSLGLFYLALTQFLGFPKYGDEYKVMGLAAYGTPSLLEKMKCVVRLEQGGRFRLNLDYFVHHTQGASMTWESGEPKMGPVYSRKMEDLLGPSRRPEDPLSDRHEDIASSMQAMYEEAFFHLLNFIHEKTKISALCLAGGCAMNSVANGKIFDRTPFREVYIQAAAGDAGGALGAAYYVWHHVLGQKRGFVMHTAYWGPEFSEEKIAGELRASAAELKKLNCHIKNIANTDELCSVTAKAIAEGKVVGWYQGRMEWGPRALGNRSIVVDPRRAEMKDVLNARIKRREPFRPFAPSILLEKTAEYFEKDYPDPFMIKVYPVRLEKRKLIPAVTHVDGSGRLQTVRREDNPLYWKLIKEFENITGVPVVLNTSFNENEPIVCSPREALDCFLRTKMDVLVLGNHFIQRRSGTE
jgi:carbamoyltransferase